MICPFVSLPLARPSQVRTEGVETGWKDFAQVIQQEFGPLGNRRILDVGGANGGLREYLGSGCYSYYNIDILPTGDVQGDAHALPFKDGEMDLVISKQTLVHFHDPVTACREMFRVAREGVVIRQEFPNGGPIGWPGHSQVWIESPLDILAAFVTPGCIVSYTGLDFIVRR